MKILSVEALGNIVSLTFLLLNIILGEQFLLL